VPGEVFLRTADKPLASGGDRHRIGLGRRRAPADGRRCPNGSKGARPVTERARRATQWPQNPIFRIESGSEPALSSITTLAAEIGVSTSVFVTANLGTKMPPSNSQGGHPLWKRRREREEAKEAARRAHAYNVLLGAQLTKHLWRVKLDDRVLKVLAAAPLASDFREIATRGARIAFPGWPTETTRRNGTVKVTYLETYDAARKAGEYLAGASKAGEVAGRSLALLAAARWADEQALPMSRRSLYTLGFARTFGVPWADEAAELLDDLLIERLSPEVTERIRAAKHAREERRAEEARREAEREQAVAELVEQAPTMTVEERRAEIARLQREYDFGVVDAETRAAIIAHPEPGGDAKTEEAAVAAAA